MKYEFMAAHQWEHRIGRMCRVLEVSRSGYYAWQARRSSVRKIQQVLEEDPGSASGSHSTGALVFKQPCRAMAAAGR
jgi:hypothetical protein